MNGSKIFPLNPEIKEAIRKFAEQTIGSTVRDTKIRSISVSTTGRHSRKLINSKICVGNELDSGLANIPHESVMAIFESDFAANNYVVVTPDKRGTVYLFDREEVVNIEKEEAS